MALDTAMFERLQKGTGEPEIRIYTWAERTITLGRGYKIKYKMSDEMLASYYPGIPILERPTGGGLVVHEPVGEITIAQTGFRQTGEPIRELYKRIHQPILAAVERLGIPTRLVTECLPDGDGICFNSPCLYDGMSGNKKILGGGLRVGKNADARYVFLYQGTLKVAGVNPAQLADILNS